MSHLGVFGCVAFSSACFKVKVQIPTGQPMELPEPRKISFGPSFVLEIDCVEDGETSHMDDDAHKLFLYSSSYVSTNIEIVADAKAVATKFDGLRRSPKRKEFMIIVVVL